MTLTLDQLRNVAQLARAVKGVELALAALEQQEDNCWRAGVSDRQIAAIVRKSHSSVSRHRNRRLRGALEAEA